MSPKAERVLQRAQRIPGRLFPSTIRQSDGGASQGEQLLLAGQYRMMRHLDVPLPALASVEFRNFSQNGEDGILLYLATVLELSYRRVVEIGCSDGIECNAANLIVHHGWEGLLLDGDAAMIERGRRFYAGQPETGRVGPDLIHSWITRTNVTSLLERHGYGADVDVLSIDIDGMDLWVIQALEPTANVLVVEYNNRLPADVAISVPYADEFSALAADPDLMRGEGCFGASLLAYVRVLRPFGYRLAGANSIGTNAFFIRDGVGDDLFTEVSAKSCLASRWATLQRERWWEELRGRDWVQIDP